MEVPYSVMMSEFVFGFDAVRCFTHGDVGGQWFLSHGQNPHARCPEPVISSKINAIQVKFAYMRLSHPATVGQAPFSG
jgi:hypothetical protein